MLAIYGITAYPDTKCVPYGPESTRDGPWNAASGLQIASLALTGITALVLLFSHCCFRLSNAAMALCGVVLLLGGVLFQGLVFLFYTSAACTDHADWAIGEFQEAGVYNNSCSVGPGGILVCVAILIFFVTSLVCCISSRSIHSTEEGSSDEAAPAKVVEDIEAPITE